MIARLRILIVSLILIACPCEEVIQDSNSEAEDDSEDETEDDSADSIKFDVLEIPDAGAPLPEPPK